MVAAVSSEFLEAVYSSLPYSPLTIWQLTSSRPVGRESSLVAVLSIPLSEAISDSRRFISISDSRRKGPEFPKSQLIFCDFFSHSKYICTVLT